MKKVALAYIGVVAITFCVLSVTAMLFGYSPTQSLSVESASATVAADTNEVSFATPEEEQAQALASIDTSEATKLDFESCGLILAGMGLIVCGLKFWTLFPGARKDIEAPETSIEKKD